MNNDWPPVKAEADQSWPPKKREKNVSFRVSYKSIKTLGLFRVLFRVYTHT